ncbi:hypothetical protein ISN44_As12g033560 [Arabidopsis suecica]|uniref:Uncharacterized protein n=1 Tax=Arabidopsis suecica TaxID=45249 RepID=A0A8T1YQ58_ARASU|nr:hypothetical protein ISN44_As12g033560 [Arabidopsis suecica]
MTGPRSVLTPVTSLVTGGACPFAHIFILLLLHLRACRTCLQCIGDNSLLAQWFSLISLGGERTDVSVLYGTVAGQSRVDARVKGGSCTNRWLMLIQFFACHAGLVFQLATVLRWIVEQHRTGHGSVPVTSGCDRSGGLWHRSWVVVIGAMVTRVVTGFFFYGRTGHEGCDRFEGMFPTVMGHMPLLLLDVPPKHVRKSLFQGSSEEDGKKKEIVKNFSQPMVNEGGLKMVVETAAEIEEKSSLVMATGSAGITSISQLEDSGVVTASVASTDVQVSGLNPMMEAGLSGNDVLMTDNALEEDDLMGDRSSSLVDEELEEVEAGQLIADEAGNNPNGSVDGSITQKSVVETGGRVRHGGVLKGVSSKKRNAQLILSPRPTIADKIPRGKRSFRFDKRWIRKDGLMEAIANCWNSDNEPGNAKFVEKLSNCRRAISQWRRQLTPFGRQTIEEIKSELFAAQRDDGRSQEEIKDLTMRLKEAYQDEELYWHQKSRSSWMQLGDNNSKYFHALTKQRRARNRISGLHDENVIWSVEDKDVQNIAVAYFKKLFTTTKPEAFEDALAEVEILITDQINVFLTAPATEGEVRAALFMMHPEKAPGPDGERENLRPRGRVLWRDVRQEADLCLIGLLKIRGYFGPVTKPYDRSQECLDTVHELGDRWGLPLCSYLHSPLASSSSLQDMSLLAQWFSLIPLGREM